MRALELLSQPGCVIPWYVVGAIAAAWVAHDLRHTNTALKQAMKWAWPIVVFFFSVLGLALYFATARAPGVARARSDDERKKLHEAFERSMVRRVNGAVIHCVAGDGLGIMTGMVIARLAGMTFWQEFWFEYLVGFCFGWLIFQLRSMTMMTDSKVRALAMAFRAEFFSMLTVMGGMGAVMAYVTPMVVGMQPKPWTAAFWGFGMLGLLVGYGFTFPMNWMIVKIGWMHGMGSARDAHPVHGRGPKLALFGAMVVLGFAALALPGWLAVVRDSHERAVATAAVARYGEAPGRAGAGAPVQRGLGAVLASARADLAQGRRRDAMAAMDSALRAAQVARAAGLAPGAHAQEVLVHARRTLQDGRAQQAGELLAQAAAPGGSEGSSAGSAAPPQAYAGAPLLDASGAVIGEVRRVRGDRARVAIGGVPDFWGFWDLGHPELAWVPLDRLVFGPSHAVGRTFAMLPTLQDAHTAVAQASASAF